MLRSNNIDNMYYYYLSSISGHEGIISRETWDKVEAKIDAEATKRSAGVYRNCTKTHFLYGKVFCAKCGNPYTRRTFTNRQGQQYKAWCCRGRKKGDGCKNVSIKDELLGAAAQVLRVETIEQGVFEKMVERILIEGEKIKLILRKIE